MTLEKIYYKGKFIGMGCDTLEEAYAYYKLNEIGLEPIPSNKYKLNKDLLEHLHDSDRFEEFRKKMGVII